MKSDALIATRAASIRSIAVLPLENLSGNPAQDYLADSMTDELITQLGQNQRAACDFQNVRDAVQRSASLLERYRS
jgi:TolB-like protein